MIEAFTGPRTNWQQHLCDEAMELLEESESLEYNRGICELVSKLVYHTEEGDQIPRTFKNLLTY